MNPSSEQLLQQDPELKEFADWNDGWNACMQAYGIRTDYN